MRGMDGELEGVEAMVAGAKSKGGREICERTVELMYYLLGERHSLQDRDQHE
ncbi:hypothetical protein AZE42_01932 [Rhizopogon vesiculosus]|uniref:Uncharacterized protein n=1 Tax=Rhizopogon vesiculosus TaxID=180088 RepID=A0A1J8QKD3_9AGAM|nr:hypothetical protein AZE42_01932 [Rhizopogon vesiculosus]